MRTHGISDPSSVGRLAFPMSKAFKDSAWWSSSLLRKAPVVGPLKAMRTSDMSVIEDLSEDTLPSTTDPTTHISPAEKVQQVGVDACLQVLQATFDGINAARTTMAVVVDPFPHTGDMLKAVIKYRGEFTGRLLYHSFAASAMEKVWLNFSVATWMQGEFLAGRLGIRGAAPLPEEVPKVILDAEIERP